MSEYAEVLGKQLELIASHQEKIAGMQFALLALAGGADNPQRMLASLERVREAVLPGANPQEDKLREAIVAQLDQLIQHLKDVTRNPDEGEL